MPMNPQFRRSAAAETRNKGKGGRGKGAWFERFRIPKDSPASFAMINTEYVDPNPPAEQVEMDPATGRPKPVKNPYFKKRQHKRSMKNGGREFYADEVCSAGYDPHRPQPCCGCFAMDSGDKSVTVADVFNFGLVHLAYYHGHPVIEDNGNVMMKRDNSGPVLNFDPCGGRICNYCRVMQGHAPIQQQGEKPWPGYDPRSLSTVFGQRKYIEIGKGHLSDLMGWDQQISSTCSTCQSILTTDGFSCPTCNNIVIDMASDTRPDEEIREAVSRPYPCLHCQRPVFLREDISCDICTPANVQVVQQGIFDVVLTGMRQGEGTNSHLVLSRWKSLEEFEKTVEPHYLQGKTLRQLVAEMGQPYDFPEMMKPRTLQEQSKRLELAVPPSTGQVPYTPYGAPSGPAPAPGAPAAAPGPAPYVAPGRPNYGR